MITNSVVPIAKALIASANNGIGISNAPGFYRYRATSRAVTLKAARVTDAPSCLVESDGYASQAASARSKRGRDELDDDAAVQRDE
ncbi:hypothetical protein GCM10027093_47050 [Paraburkholderia jirisanensis]